MGGSSSKSVTKITNDIMTEIINENIQNCGVAATQSIDTTYTISGSGIKIGEIGAENISHINLKCLFEPDVTNKISQDLQNKIQAEVEAASSGVLAALSRADAKTTVEAMNSIKNKLTNTNIQNCVSSVDQNIRATVNVTGDQIEIGTITFRNVAENVADCISRTLIANELETLSRVEAETQTTAETEASLGAELGAFFGGIFGGMASPLIIMVVGGIGGLIFLILLMWGISKLGGGSDDTVNVRDFPDEDYDEYIPEDYNPDTIA